MLAALAGVCATALIAFLLNPSFLWSGDLALTRGPLSEDEAIVIETGAAVAGVRKGDAFTYYVEVRYNPERVSGIERASLDRGLYLQPFEIREIKESESELDSRTRVYRREYELQLIKGEVGALYEFPSLVVRYTAQKPDEVFQKTIVPEAIFVASRLPAEVGGLELRPLKGKVEDQSQNRLAWILWTLGAVLLALGAADVAWRTIPTWKALTKETRKLESGDLLVQAYRSLCANVAIGSEPTRVLHQMDRILRVVLARKEGLDLLQEPDLDSVAADIRPTVRTLCESLGKNHMMVAERRETDEPLELLQRVLHFYFGEAEIESWRS